MENWLTVCVCVCVRVGKRGSNDMKRKFGPDKSEFLSENESEKKSWENWGWWPLIDHFKNCLLQLTEQNDLFLLPCIYCISQIFCAFLAVNWDYWYAGWEKSVIVVLLKA